MKDTVKRALISVAVFAVIYFVSGPLIGTSVYDMYLKGIEFLILYIRIAVDVFGLHLGEPDASGSFFCKI